MWSCPTGPPWRGPRLACFCLVDRTLLWPSSPGYISWGLTSLETGCPPRHRARNSHFLTTWLTVPTHCPPHGLHPSSLLPFMVPWPGAWPCKRPCPSSPSFSALLSLTLAALGRWALVAASLGSLPGRLTLLSQCPQMSNSVESGPSPKAAVRITLANSGQVCKQPGKDLTNPSLSTMVTEARKDTSIPGGSQEPRHW